jgi:hypothetical protein
MNRVLSCGGGLRCYRRGSLKAQLLTATAVIKNFVFEILLMLEIAPKKGHKCLRTSGFC